MEDVTRVEDGRGVVFKRGGFYHARIRVGPNKYVYRTLKTGKKAVAIKAAQRLVHQLEFRAEHHIPITIKKFVDVIDEYETFRTKQHQQGHTSATMLRQIIRVNKFWREFAGKRLITNIDNAAFKEFVEWRKDYYHRKTEAELKDIRNYKLNPTDKTMQWEIAHGKAILKWAHDKKYLGKMALPTFTFTPKVKRVRPAFELSEYRLLWRALVQWERDNITPEFLHTRQLLRDYVLILANSGMRVGEANKLRHKDIQPFTDGAGRPNYRLIVRGKTGERDVIPRVITKKYIDRLIARKKNPKPDDWLFAMKSGSKIITLIDQFDKVIENAGIKTNSHGEKFSLYSLRHFYAVQGLRNGIGIYDIARNMGSSVQMIQSYYGRQATPMTMATTLGGKVRKPAATAEKKADAADASPAEKKQSKKKE